MLPGLVIELPSSTRQSSTWTGHRQIWLCRGRGTKMCFPRCISRLIGEQCIDCCSQRLTFYHARENSTVTNAVLNKKRWTLVYLESVKLCGRGRRTCSYFRRLRMSQQFRFFQPAGFRCNVNSCFPAAYFLSLSHCGVRNGQTDSIIGDAEIF